MKCLISKKIVISTFSPLLIGAKNPEYGWGLWKLGERERYVYVVDLDKFMAYLDEVGLVERFAEQFNNPKSFSKNRNWVNSFLRDNGVLRGLNTEKKRKIARKISSSIVYLPGGGRGNSFIRSGTGDVIVPGSSIKGALRTAMVYKILKNLKQRDPNNFRRLVVREVNNRIQKRQTFSKNILEMVLYPPNQTSANFDLFRSVKITDGTVLRPNITAGYVAVLNIGNAAIGLKCGGDGRPLNIRCEYLPQRTNISFKCSLDLEIYDRIKNQLKVNNVIYPHLPDISCVQDLLDIAIEFTNGQWDYEQQFTNAKLKSTGYQQLAEFYQKSIPQDKQLFLRLGWGTGMLGMTIDLLFDGGQYSNLRQRIRNITHNRGNAPAPKSRRLLQQSNTYKPFGWIVNDSKSKTI